MSKYRSFSGADITATFAGRPIGSLLSLAYTSRREKSPVFTMGFKNARGVARGRRAIGGRLMFAVFDHDALMEEMRKRDDSHNFKDQKMKFYTYATNTETGERLPMEGHEADSEIFQPTTYNEMLSRATNNDGIIDMMAVQGENLKYADQIQPFDLVVNFLNEGGDRAKLVLKDVEILNEGMGMSINDIAISQNYSFIAMDMEPIVRLDENGNKMGTGKKVIESGYFTA